MGWSIRAGLRNRAKSFTRSRPRTAVRAERLESRRLLSTNLVAQSAVGSTATSVTNPKPQGTTPAQILQAYGFNQLPSKINGSGQTIAIVVPYNDPNLTKDVYQFDSQFDLPDPNLMAINEQGSTSSLPGFDPGWALETSLDVEWAHAVAPKANILVVEANSPNISDLMTAVNTARDQPNVSVVSMSWGIPERFLGSSLEHFYDPTFTTPSGHIGVTFVASSGDDGGVFGPDWPAVSPNVLSVGGTSLPLNSQGQYPTSGATETAWYGSGGGLSYFEPEPTYQASVQSTGRRSSPDVAYNASPSTGFAVYDSSTYLGQSGWFQVGGTSAGAPQWAGLIALADQARGTSGSLDGVTQTLPAIYAAGPSAFHAITVSSVLGPQIQTTSGYNLVTGLGSPVVNDLLPKLVNPGTPPAPTTPTNTGSGFPMPIVIFRSFDATSTNNNTPPSSTNTPAQNNANSNAIANPNALAQLIFSILISGSNALPTPVPFGPQITGTVNPNVDFETHVAPGQFPDQGTPIFPARPPQPLLSPAEPPKSYDWLEDLDHGVSQPRGLEEGELPLGDWLASRWRTVAPEVLVQGRGMIWDAAVSSCASDQEGPPRAPVADRTQVTVVDEEIRSPLESALMAGLVVTTWGAWQWRSVSADLEERRSREPFRALARD